MKFADYSPPASPSLTQQLDALQKGLGRAMQWAMVGRLDEATLLEACLHDWRFDRQVDDSRGDWLWKLVNAIGAEERLRMPILDALCQLSDWRVADQLCEFGLQYALKGDHRFRKRLYEIVEARPFADMASLAEYEIMQLDGERGFMFAARIRGEKLKERKWDWDDDYLIRRAADQFDKNRVATLLDDETDEAIKRYRDGWRQQENAESNPDHVSHTERVRQMAVGEIVSKAESGDQAFAVFRTWGKCASEADLDEICQRLLTAQMPRSIANYLAVFSIRECPRFLPQFIDLCQHTDKEIRRRAFSALEVNADPAVRQFAESQLRHGVCDRLVISLFIKNYRRGDEKRILESIEIPEDENELHWTLMDMEKILENNPQADRSELGILAYALTPCGNCRHHAASLLHAQAVAPKWLTEECRFDAESDTRQLAEDTASKNVRDSTPS